MLTICVYIIISYILCTTYITHIYVYTYIYIYIYMVYDMPGGARRASRTARQAPAPRTAPASTPGGVRLCIIMPLDM